MKIRVEKLQRSQRSQLSVAFLEPDPSCGNTVVHLLSARHYYDHLGHVSEKSKNHPNPEIVYGKLLREGQ